MARKTKKNSGIYEYLSANGLLQQSTEQIEQAKKQYWNNVRKEYKRLKRKKNRSYTIFFDMEQLKQVTQKAKQRNGSISYYIKQSALNNDIMIDKKAIGEIRQMLALHYNAIESLYNEHILREQIADELLQQIVAIEKKVFSVLPNVT